jgi:hypothetical protein
MGPTEDDVQRRFAAAGGQSTRACVRLGGRKLGWAEAPATRLDFGQVSALKSSFADQPGANSLVGGLLGIGGVGTSSGWEAGGGAWRADRRKRFGLSERFRLSRCPRCRFSAFRGVWSSAGAGRPTGRAAGGGGRRGASPSPPRNASSTAGIAVRSVIRRTTLPHRIRAASGLAARGSSFADIAS